MKRTQTQQTRRLRARKDERYREILGEAAAIFRSNGYDATTLQEIADAVGIQKGSLYHYIDSKQDLLFTMIDEAHQGVLEGNQRWRDDALDPLQRIRLFVEDHARVSLELVDYASVYFTDFRALDAERRARIIAARDDYQAALAGLIEDARRAGQVRRDVDPRLATFAVFGMINWVYHWYRRGGERNADAIIGGLADMAMAGIAA